MAGLTDLSGDAAAQGQEQIAQAHAAWQQSMTRRLQELRDVLSQRDPHHVAACSGAEISEAGLRLRYWSNPILVTLPEWQVIRAEGEPCPTFDAGMLLYYLSTADGSPLADRWIAFRELPDGGFYHQAFQGYSGDLLARAIGQQPEALEAAAEALGGIRLPHLAPAAFTFTPLPRVRLAAALWPGDEDFPARASILFDAAASHYLPTDGLALLGAGLARRLIRAVPPSQSRPRSACGEPS